MATVIRGDARAAARLADADPAALVVCVEASAAERRGRDFAAVRVAARDPALAARITAAVACAIGAAAQGAAAGADPRAVRVRSRKVLDRLGPEAVAGAVAVVPVATRRLGELVDALRERGALGVQLVWDEAGDRARTERRVFSILEKARATPKLPPVVLARIDEPMETLRVLIAVRAQAGKGDG